MKKLLFLAMLVALLASCATTKSGQPKSISQKPRATVSTIEAVWYQTVKDTPSRRSAKSVDVHRCR